MTAFVYDTGALIAAEDNDRRIWTIHRRALERRAVPIVPAGVVAEAWRGNSASLARFLAGAQVEPLDAKSARAAGVLLSNVADRDVGAVDATVLRSPCATATPYSRPTMPMSRCSRTPHTAHSTSFRSRSPGQSRHSSTDLVTRFIPE
ncbi:MAG: hypothetical protein QG671_667 [Actinomycetota bacterium]|nr:hypothetical protein [Actinomycetota bacterium]